MELNITEMFGKFFNGIDRLRNYQDSIANSGRDDIAKITWNNAKNAPYSFVTDENRETVIDYFKEYGAWDGLDRWSNKDLDALLVQEIVNSIQELEGLKWDWQAYQEESENGQVSGRIFENDGKVYFYVGN